MSKQLLTLAALLVSSVTSATPAPEDAYDLRGPAPKKGMVIRDTMVFKMIKADLSVDIGNGNKFDGTMDMTATSESEEEILGVDGRDVTKLRTKVLKDDVARKTTVNGKTDSDTEKKSLVGEIVYSEKTKNGWKHSLEDAKPTDKQEKELKDFDDPVNDDDLYPEGKVKVGHSWDIDANAFKKVVGSKMTDAKGSGKGKLVSIDMLNGEACAVIEIEFDVKARLKQEDSDFQVTMKGKIKSYRSIAEGIDLKFSIDGTAKFDGDAEEDGMKYQMVFSGKMTGEGTTIIKKK